MKRLTVAAAALAAGMLTIVAQSQAESDRNMLHKPVAKVAAADRKVRKACREGHRCQGLVADRQPGQDEGLDGRQGRTAKTKALMAAKANAKPTAKELGIDAQKTAPKDIAGTGAKRIASLSKTVKTGKAKPKSVAIDLAEDGVDRSRTAEPQGDRPQEREGSGQRHGRRGRCQRRRLHHSGLALCSSLWRAGVAGACRHQRREQLPCRTRAAAPARSG